MKLLFSLSAFLPSILFCIDSKAQQNPIDYLPSGYVIFDSLKGDLNSDGLEDYVMIIKGTDKSLFVNDENNGLLDRNRRGIIVLLKKANTYQLFLKNEQCFSSENEDGGVYYAPELSFDIEKGNLYFHYSHGRYGFWHYAFQLRNHDFELIAFHKTESDGPSVQYVTDIDFLRKKVQEKENIKFRSPDGSEKFNTKWKDLKNSKIYRLSEISDFDELYFYDY